MNVSLHKPHWFHRVSETQHPFIYDIEMLFTDKKTIKLFSTYILAMLLVVLVIWASQLNTSMKPTEFNVYWPFP